MTAPLTMHEAAAAVGLSYERFRKIWPSLCAGQAFPQPFRARVWDAAAIEAWKAQRSARALQPVANDPEPPTPPALQARARRGRALLEQLRRA